jgi:hypothetical protein
MGPTNFYVMPLTSMCVFFKSFEIFEGVYQQRGQRQTPAAPPHRRHGLQMSSKHPPNPEV